MSKAGARGEYRNKAIAHAASFPTQTQALAVLVLEDSLNQVGILYLVTVGSYLWTWIASSWIPVTF